MKASSSQSFIPSFSLGHWVRPQGEEIFLVDPLSQSLDVVSIPCLSLPDLAKALSESRTAFLKAKSEAVPDSGDWKNRILESLDEICRVEALAVGMCPKRLWSFSYSNLAERLARGQTSGQGFRRPRGVLGLAIARGPFFSKMVEILDLALERGNHFFLLMPPQFGSFLQKTWELWAPPTSLQGRVQVFFSGKVESRNWLSQHPALAGLALFGTRSEIGASVTQAHLKGKDVLALYQGKDNLIVLDASSLTPEILQENLNGFSLGPAGCQQVYYLQDMEEKFFNIILEFEKRVERKLEKKPFSPGDSSFFWSTEAFEHELKQIASLEGRLLCGGRLLKDEWRSPAFVRDLTHCTELHQEVLSSPVVLLNSVKYQHEISRWSALMEEGASYTIVGPEEKAIKLSKQLEAAQIFVNAQSRELSWGQSFGYGSYGAGFLTGEENFFVRKTWLRS